MKKTYHFFALAALGDGLSGGDRIFIELARRWARWGIKIKIYVWQEGYEITQAQNLRHKNIEFVIVNMGIWPKFGFLANYLARIVAGIKLGLTLRVKKDDYLYSASDFLMDMLPAYILKLRFDTPTWFAGWYQTAPNPLKGYTEGKREHSYKFTALFYWLSQKLSKPFIVAQANFVLVNNENEKKQFMTKSREKAVIVVHGAVSVKEIRNWLSKNKLKKKKYDAVFQGRLHPQKGVVEMIEIWGMVVRNSPAAKLAIIGDGELMGKVKAKISKLKLNKNVTLFGYVFDGAKKYSIFFKSKLALHPAFFDSGGMAAAEAMAFGIPAIGFNLDSYKYYYPKGMVKVEKGDLVAFSEEILHLLKNNKKRAKLGQEAKLMIGKTWSWEARAREVLKAIGS
ncbi:MAG: Glycosyltransferase [Candidatus Woesebacteria bacterium GW2011_GWB1_38_5b]|uniref:Glycosyltransferase n=1 Tax=Candidatus Woesebacteria bacterium GW2011_GWB1_38_5b TaxID=1618569 RepID=A0A0G0K7S7_9BACT|nr:MAG: Glycosyltransferase [Candidatus Woesebacteria bacterium GW2011_GWB1_38_5b]